MRKKIIKYVSVLVACIIASCLFIAPVSAVSSDTFGYTFNIQKPVVNSNSGYIEMITENWGPMLMYFNASYQLTNENNVNANDGAFNFYADITTDNQLIIKNQGSIYYFDENGYLCPLTIFGFYMTPEGWVNWGGSSTTLRSDGTVNYSPYSLYLGNCGDILYARGYNINLNSLGVSAEFPSFVYGSETVIYNQLQSIEQLLSQNNSGFQSIINNANQNASNIQSNANNNADEIQANADKNAAQIQQNQDKNTDKLLNGDADLDSSGETNKVNGTVGGIDDATDEALGGKNDAEIQSEVGGALDPGQLGNIDVTKAKRMSTFYDRCLQSFGSDYNSLLLLSLVLGLGAFLIGRRYG